MQITRAEDRADQPQSAQVGVTKLGGDVEFPVLGQEAMLRRERVVSRLDADRGAGAQLADPVRLDA